MKLIETKRNGTQVYLDDVCPRCVGAGAADKWSQTGLTCWDCGGTGKRPTPRRVTVYPPEIAARRREKAAAKLREKHIADCRRRCGFDVEAAVGYAYTGDTKPIKETLKAAGGRWNEWIRGWIVPRLVEGLEGVTVTRLDGADVLNQNGYLQDREKLLAAMGRAAGPAYPVSEAKCRGCSSCALVTESLNGVRFDAPYYQCLAGVEADCRGE